jgi:exonuclease III
MKIISWNIERPKIDKKLAKNKFIIEQINLLNPDIIFLTETNSIIDFGTDYYSLKSEELPKIHDNQDYYQGENRVTIFSKYKFENIFETYDKFSSVCGKVETEFGVLNLYGSIIGSFGGKDLYFKNDLKHQKIDILRLDGNICFSGDFNISFSGFPYPNKQTINETNEFFKENKLVNLTNKNENCAIHIVFNEDFISDKKIQTKMTIIERKISDHNLVITEII